MKKLVVIFIFLGVFLSLAPSVSFAKRLLPQAVKSSGSSTKTVVTNSKGVGVSVKFRSDRRAINVNFSNLTIASKVDYTLSYDTKGVTQGASGSISTTSATGSRELIFGTCSSGICRYDSGITNAKFVVTTTLKNGKKVVRTFKLKV